MCTCPICGAEHAKLAPEQVDLAGRIAQHLNAESERIAALTAESVNRLPAAQLQAQVCMLCGANPHTVGCVAQHQQEVKPDWLVE